MQLFKEGSDLVINAIAGSRGYAVLEKLGYFSQEQVRLAQKKDENKSRIKAWVEENCCSGCRRKKATCVCVDGVPPAPRVVAGASRKSLMEEAKARGISYFRVMNKEELSEIITGDSQAMRDDAGSRIRTIQETAKARWQAGWKK